MSNGKNHKQQCELYRSKGTREKNKANKQRKREEHKIGTRQRTGKPSKYLGGNDAKNEG